MYTAWKNSPVKRSLPLLESITDIIFYLASISISLDFFACEIFPSAFQVNIWLWYLIVTNDIRNDIKKNNMKLFVELSIKL